MMAQDFKHFLMALWIASYPDGSWRKSDGDGRGRSLGTPSWFLSRLSQVGGNTCPRQVLWEMGGGAKYLSDKNGRTGAVITSFVKLQPGMAYHGFLTDWSQENRMQFEYLGKPKDSYSVIVETVYNCVDREDAGLCYTVKKKNPSRRLDGGSRGALGGLGKCRPGYPLRILEWDGLADTKRLTKSEQFHWSAWY